MEVIRYECKEPGHFKDECPKLQKDRPRKKAEKKKKVRMATWDDSESSDASLESDGDCANAVFMADTGSEAESFGSKSESDSEEVFAELSRSELTKCLSEMFEKYNQIRIKYKKMQSSLAYETNHLNAEIDELKENNSKLKTELEKAQQLSESDTAVCSKNILKQYDYNFQQFLTKRLDRSKMASMIYGVNRNNISGIGYEPPFGKGSEHPKSVGEMIIKYTPLYSNFKWSFS